MNKTLTNSTLKKVIALTLVVSVMAFSCIGLNVYAANPSTFNDYSASISSNNVRFLLRAVQFKSSSLGTSMLPGGMESVFYVTLEIRNSNTQAAVVRPPEFDITITEDKTVSHMYSYSSDLLLEKHTWFKVVPSSDFSYASGGSELIVVPPETSLYFVGAICTTAQLDQTGQTIQDAGLRGVNFVESDYYVTKGDYPYGSAVDLSPVTAYLDNIDENIEDISTAITNLIDAVTYSGTFASVIPSASQQYVAFSGLSSADGKFDISGRRVISVPIVDSIDSYLDPNTDIQRYNVQCHYDVSYYFLFNNKYSNSQSAYLESLNYLQVYAPNSGGYQNNVVEFQSDVFEEYYVSQASQVRFIPKYRNTSGRALYPSNGSYAYIKFRFYFTYSGGNLPNLQTFDASIINGITNGFTSTAVDQVITNTDSATLRNIEKAIKDILASYNAVNGLDDLGDDDITDTSDDIHTQEESYYASNAAAIQQTGLSNYRFNTETQNGIGSVSNDFVLVWNSLGSFNSVFVFSLTLSLALMILRHAPSAIRSYRRRSDE